MYLGVWKECGERTFSLTENDAFCIVYSPPSFPLNLKNISVILISFHLLKIIVNENLLADDLKELI